MALTDDRSTDAAGAPPSRPEGSRRPRVVALAAGGVAVAVAVVVAVVVAGSTGERLPETTRDLGRLTGPAVEAGLTCAPMVVPEAGAPDPSAEPAAETEPTAETDPATAAAGRAVATYDARAVESCTGPEGAAVVLAVFDDAEVAEAFAFDVSLSEAVHLRYGDAWVALGSPDVLEEIQATGTWNALTPR